MRVSLANSRIEGEVTAPPSKSYTIRGLMCAALADGESVIRHPLVSDDSQAALNVLHDLGISIRQEKNLWRISGGSFQKPAGDLYCGDSAATLRFMTAICALVPGRCRLTAGPSLSRRPVRPLVKALKQLGVNCSSQGEVPPVIVEGGTLKGGTTELPGDISSQFISALLFIVPCAEEGMSIVLSTPLQSEPYVLMTIDCLNKFGIQVFQSREKLEAGRQKYQPAEYAVEGDWSSASYFLALGATSGEITIGNLNPRSLQGDKIMLNLLGEMGARVREDGNNVTVSKTPLRAVKADLSECIDLLPTMAALAAVAEGVSEFTGIRRARLKESDRVTAMSEGLSRMGIETTVADDTMTITGGIPRGTVVDSYGDHRIAMALSVIGLVAGETVIDGAECVTKTFPEFWDIIGTIGAEVKINGQ